MIMVRTLRIMAAFAACLLFACSASGDRGAPDGRAKQFLQQVVASDLGGSFSADLIEFVLFDPTRREGSKVFIATADEPVFSRIFGNLMIDGEAREVARLPITSQRFAPFQVRARLTVVDGNDALARMQRQGTDDHAGSTAHWGGRSMVVVVRRAADYKEAYSVLASGFAARSASFGEIEYGCAYGKSTLPRTPGGQSIALLLDDDGILDLTEERVQTCTSALFERNSGFILNPELAHAVQGLDGPSAGRRCELAKVLPYPSPRSTAKLDVAGCPEAPDFRLVAASALLAAQRRRIEGDSSKIQASDIRRICADAAGKNPEASMCSF